MGRSRKGAQDLHKHGSVAVTVLERDIGRVVLSKRSLHLCGLSDSPRWAARCCRR